MTKLEKKLIELGYEYDNYIKIYSKEFEDYTLWLVIKDNKIVLKKFFSNYRSSEFEKIEKIINEMKKDLEVLKQYENIKTN